MSKERENATNHNYNSLILFVHGYLLADVLLTTAGGLDQRRSETSPTFKRQNPRAL